MPLHAGRRNTRRHSKNLIAYWLLIPDDKPAWAISSTGLLMRMADGDQWPMSCVIRLKRGRQLFTFVQSGLRRRKNRDIDVLVDTCSIMFHDPHERTYEEDLLLAEIRGRARWASGSIRRKTKKGGLR